MKGKHQKQLKKCIIETLEICSVSFCVFCLLGLVIMINCKRTVVPKSVGFNELHLSHPHTFFPCFSTSSLHVYRFFSCPICSFVWLYRFKYMKCSFRNRLFLAFIAFLWMWVIFTGFSSSLSKHTHLIFFS